MTVVDLGNLRNPVIKGREAPIVALFAVKAPCGIGIAGTVAPKTLNFVLEQTKTLIPCRFVPKIRNKKWPEILWISMRY